MRYRTIVADPPWEITAGPRRSPVSGRGVGNPRKLAYPTMTVDEIRDLLVGRFADPDGCHLYLWVPNRHVEESYGVARAWGFAPGQLLTWCKAPRGLGLGGTYVSTTEFVLFSRRGHPQYRGAPRCDTTWWKWTRPESVTGPTHSRKPEAFLDMVEQVSPGPYLELFARRNRLGWDTWGNEALCHVEMAATT